MTPVVAYLWDRQFLLRVGVRFEVGRILEDLVFTTTALSAASRVVYLPFKVYRYVRRPGSILQRRGIGETLRYAEDGEHAVAGMEALRRELGRRGSTPPGYLDRLLDSEQRIVFLIIARFIRSGIPVSPSLTDALGRFRRLSVYPIDQFPTGDWRTTKIVVLTWIFNRPLLVRAFAVGLRLGISVSRLPSRFRLRPVKHTAA